MARRAKTLTAKHATASKTMGANSAVSAGKQLTPIVSSIAIETNPAGITHAASRAAPGIWLAAIPRVTGAKSRASPSTQAMSRTCTDTTAQGFAAIAAASFIAPPNSKT